MSKQSPDVSEGSAGKSSSSRPDAPAGGGGRKAPKPVRIQMDTLADVPDRFMVLWQKIADKIIAYFSRVLLLVVGAVLVFIAAWGIGQWMEARREKSTEILGKVLRIADAELLRDNEKTDSDETETPRYKTTKERTDATLKALDDLDHEYGSSDAARRGQLVRAGILYDQGRAADAEALYHRFIDSKPSETSLLALAYEGLGLCAEARSDWGAALAAFERQANEPFARERGQWNQARIYTKKGDKQKAIEVYKELLSKAAPQSPLRDDVQNRLASLEP